MLCLFLPSARHASHTHANSFFFFKVAQAAALGFEACDNRLREAISESLKSSVAIELEAAYKRVEVGASLEEERTQRN